MTAIIESITVHDTPDELSLDLIAHHRGAGLPARAPYPFTTADRMPQWLAVLEEECTRRGLPPTAPCV
jgi:hypothetical protein